MRVEPLDPGRASPYAHEMRVERRDFEHVGAVPIVNIGHRKQRRCLTPDVVCVRSVGAAL
jgi:hypothetical protein